MFQIAVYAIAKNEEQHVERWYNSVQYADGIYVADTGSDDSTAQLLRDKGVNVFEAHLEPFRFDAARNFILNQIPEEYDYVLFLDMDEVLEDDWYPRLQELLSDNPLTTAVHLRMVFEADENNQATTTYNRLAVTKNKEYSWKYPVHEVLVPNIETPNELFSDIRIRHLPDETKSRSSYLDLLYLAVQENPDDPRCAQYLAREHYITGDYLLASSEYQRHLQIETHPWFRSESYRQLANLHEHNGDTLEARDCHTFSCAVAPDIRESWGDAAAFYFRQERMHACLGHLENMMEVAEAPEHTIIRNESYYSAWPHHLAALCFFRLNDTKNAKIQINKAFRLSPKDPAILNDIMTICNVQIQT